MTWTPPSARERKAILDRTRSIAIVGISSKPSRASYFVATYLLSSSADYDVYFVNPAETEVLGHRVSQVDCKRIGIPCGSRDGMYVTELFVDGQLVAKSNHRDWRKAYKGLVLEVEKLFADGVALV